MKRATIWRCDVCGKEVEGRGVLPSGWGDFYFYHFTPGSYYSTVDTSGDFCCRGCAIKAATKIAETVTKEKT